MPLFVDVREAVCVLDEVLDEVLDCDAVCEEDGVPVWDRVDVAVWVAVCDGGM